MTSLKFERNLPVVSSVIFLAKLWIIPVNVIVSKNGLQFPMEEWEKNFNKDNFVMIAGREDSFIGF